MLVDRFLSEMVGTSIILTVYSIGVFTLGMIVGWIIGRRDK